MLILLMFLHVCWLMLLYTALTILRAPTAWNIDTKSGRIASLQSYEPKVSANLSNQFEWPLLFYACCILTLNTGLSDGLLQACAVVFVLGRLLHSIVQIFTDNVRLRGLVFSINFAAVFFMWLRLLMIYPIDRFQY